MREMPKSVLRQLRELAAQAHEEELRRVLLPLAESFERWKAGRLETSDLVDLLHEFHQGPARELSGRYNSKPIEAPVAFAVASGVLDRKSVPEDVLKDLAPLIEFYEEGDSRK